MQCQMETPEQVPGRSVLVDVFERIRHNYGSLASPDPDDLQGLREWVAAKRIHEIKTKENHIRMYSAPWRIG